MSGLKITGGELAAYYSSSSNCTHFIESLDSLIAADKEAVTGGVPLDPLQVEKDKSENFDWNTSTRHQIKVLIHRVILKVIRNYPVTIGTFFRFVFLCCLH